jgi:hypothetical protein
MNRTPGYKIYKMQDVQFIPNILHPETIKLFFSLEDGSHCVVKA